LFEAIAELLLNDGVLVLQLIRGIVASAALKPMFREMGRGELPLDAIEDVDDRLRL
jgi:hypothetical protein